jgi:hypothetical protein
MDLLMLALLIVGSAGVVFYVHACLGLIEPANGEADRER